MRRRTLPNGPKTTSLRGGSVDTPLPTSARPCAVYSRKPRWREYTSERRCGANTGKRSARGIPTAARRIRRRRPAGTVSAAERLARNPDGCDARTRGRARNATLADHPLLRWYDGWHRVASATLAATTTPAVLEEFKRRPVRLLRPLGDRGMPLA
mmetsp:Transcript_4506/g.8773  ORF Transcript_4506/g.8773 Transcript_4506/m.8773 type:complete len:155 (-) Transcript_4506:301-765(-)